MAFLFGRWQLGKVSHMKETPVVFLPSKGVLATAWTMYVTFPALNRLKRKIPTATVLPLGWTLALTPLLELTQAARTSRHISAGLPGLTPHVEEQSKLLWRLTNDLTSLIRVWGLLTYQMSVLKQLRNVGRKGHVLALTKLGSRKVFVLHRPKHDSKS